MNHCLLNEREKFCAKIFSHYADMVIFAASVDELFHSVDDKLFEKIVCNSVHALQPLIPDRPPSSYDLSLRTHDKLLLNKTSYLNDREFIIRMLYKDSY